MRDQHHYKPDKQTDAAWKGMLATFWPQEKSFSSRFSAGSSHCGALSGDSSPCSNNENVRECAIPEYPLAWSSVLTTGLQKVGKGKKFNGKSLRILKMLTIHMSKMAHSFLSHTSDFRSDTPPSSFITCHGTTTAYALTAVWQAITGFTLGVLLMPARY